MAKNRVQRDEVGNHGVSKSKITRRDFLKYGAMGMSLPAITAMVASCTPPAQQTVAKAVTVEVEKVVEKVVTAVPEQLKGKVVFGYDGWGQAAYDRIFEEFRKQYPGIELETQLVAEDSFADKMVTMAASGSMAWDVCLGFERKQEFIEAGWCMPLDGIVRKELLDDLTDLYKKVMTYKGFIWGLPWYQHYGVTLNYNRKMWADAGIPEGPALTWPEFSNQLYQIRDKGVTKYPFVTSGMQDLDSRVNFNPTVKGMGGYWFEPWSDPADIKPAFTTNDKNMEAIEWTLKLIRDGIIHPSLLTIEHHGAADIFNAGESAAVIQPFYYAYQSADPKQSKVADSVGCALMPGHDGKTNGGGFVGGYSYNLLTAAKDRDFEAAVAFYEFIGGPWANGVFCSMTGLGPAYKSLQGDPEVIKGLPFLPVWAEQGEQSTLLELDSQWGLAFRGLGVQTEWEELYEKHLSAAYAGQIDGKTMWKNMEEEYLTLEVRAIKEGRTHEV